jgi:hypothetical protein
LYLIDWEFATTGPLSFDVGCLLGNLMLAVLSLKGMAETEQQQQQQQPAQTRKQQAEELLQVCGMVPQSLPSCDRVCAYLVDTLPSIPNPKPCGMRACLVVVLQVMVDVWLQFTQLYPVRLQAAAAAAGGDQSVAARSHLQQQQEHWQQQLLADR